MATLNVIAFHNEKMAQEKERVMMRIANGLKSDSSSIIARRMMNPSFRGMVNNSTGSRNMPFFATKDESNVTLESKIKLRGGKIQRRDVFVPHHQIALPIETHVEATNQLDMNPNIIASPFIAPEKMHGGVLTNFKYATKILKRRADDVRNMELDAEGLQRNATVLTVLSEIDSRKLELANVLDFVGQSVANGDYGIVSSVETRNMFRLIIALAPILTEAEIGDIISILDNIIENLKEGERDTTQGRLNLDNIHSTRRVAGEINAGGSVMSRLREFLISISGIINRPVRDKIRLATVLARELGSIVGLKQTLLEIQENVDFLKDEMKQNIRTRVPKTEVIPSTASIDAQEEAQEDAQEIIDEDLVLSEDEEEEEEDEEEDDEEQIDFRQTILDLATDMYDARDIKGLQRLLRENAPRLRASKFFKPDASRTVLLNAIKNLLR